MCFQTEFAVRMKLLHTVTLPHTVTQMFKQLNCAKWFRWGSANNVRYLCSSFNAWATWLLGFMALKWILIVKSQTWGREQRRENRGYLTWMETESCLQQFQHPSDHLQLWFQRYDSSTFSQLSQLLLVRDCEVYCATLSFECCSKKAGRSVKKVIGLFLYVYTVYMSASDCMRWRLKHESADPNQRLVEEINEFVFVMVHRYVTFADKCKEVVSKYEF